MEDEEIFLAIIRGARLPDPEAYNRGWSDHEAGKEFHEGPQPSHTVEALSWRLGWNGRALKIGR